MPKTQYAQQYNITVTQRTLLNGIEYSRRMAGDITVILWRKKAGQTFALLGKNPASSIPQKYIYKL